MNPILMRLAPLGPVISLFCGLVGVAFVGISKSVKVELIRRWGVGSLILAALFVAFALPGSKDISPLLHADGMTKAWCCVFYAGALPFLIAGTWVEEVPVLLLLGSLLGMTFLAFSANLLMLFIALELLSLPVYLLVALNPGKGQLSWEAAIKYFFAGSVSAAFFLLGLACHYWATGGFGFAANTSDLDQIAFTFMAVAALFKIGAVPWHFWLPDVYEASAPMLTGFLSTSVKAAGVLMLMRLGQFSHAHFAAFLPAIGALTMLVAAFSALNQKKLQRLLAYSSLGHAGVLVLGVGAWILLGANLKDALPLFFYLFAYVFMSNGAFFFLEVSGISDWDGLKGLGRGRPFLALCFAALAMSLAGIPPTAGFLAKFLIFWQAFEAGLYIPLIVASGATLVALVYYLRVVREMYFETSLENSTQVHFSYSRPNLIVALCAACSAMVGFIPWVIIVFRRVLG